jgi:hypothetical protein
MTTKRKSSKATSREGINFVRSLVERHNSTFQEIDLDNDLGNDAYIEFVVEENSTGCCIAAQIKSGKSYVAHPGERFAFSADRDHFEYWNSHTLPVVGIIFDPQARRAFWVDISKYLRSNPSVIRDGPYTVEAHASEELSDATFGMFRQHFLTYRERYSGESNLGRALESFADRDDIERCFDGLRALFSFHRQQLVVWYYLISCLSNYRDSPLLTDIVVRLCHIPGHGDIWWHKDNMIDEKIRAAARAFMRERLDRRDAITLLAAVDERGIDRGTIGQCVHAIINEMSNPGSIMESIIFDITLPEEQRHIALYLAIDYAQRVSRGRVLDLIRRVRRAFPESMWDAELLEVRRIIREHGGVSLY